MSDAFIGEIRAFAFGYAPQNWFPCQGQIMAIHQYTALFSLLGTTYGGDGKTTFALPDFRGRAPVHPGGEIGRGEKDGEESHRLSSQEMPLHTHSVNAGSGGTLNSNPQGNVWSTLQNNINLYHPTPNTSMGATAIGPSGDNSPHSNMQPYAATNYCICVIGIYPPRS